LRLLVQMTKRVADALQRMGIAHIAKRRVVIERKE
jgi:hypothetical protein